MSNHAELSKELALALGYHPESVSVPFNEWCEVYRNHMQRSDGSLMPVWVTFDYRDPSVCLPLIKWLMVEHGAVIDYGNSSLMYWVQGAGKLTCADTLEEAVARAVIAVGVR